MQILPWRKMTDNPKHSKENNDKQREKNCRAQRSGGWLGNMGGAKYTELTNLQTK